MYQVHLIFLSVQASDLDLDPVSYSIMSGDNSSNFVIDSRTGVVRLVKHREPNLVGPYYVLNISASDGLHSSQAVLVVAIQDINNHKPVFRDCDKYRPIIAENLPPGSPVIQVCCIPMLLLYYKVDSCYLYAPSFFTSLAFSRSVREALSLAVRHSGIQAVRGPVRPSVRPPARHLALSNRNYGFRGEPLLQC